MRRPESHPMSRHTRAFAANARLTRGSTSRVTALFIPDGHLFVQQHVERLLRSKGSAALLIYCAPSLAYDSCLETVKLIIRDNGMGRSITVHSCALACAACCASRWTATGELFVSGDTRRCWWTGRSNWDDWRQDREPGPYRLQCIANMLRGKASAPGRTCSTGSTGYLRAQLSLSPSDE